MAAGSSGDGYGCRVEAFWNFTTEQNGVLSGCKGSPDVHGAAAYMYGWSDWYRLLINISCIQNLGNGDSTYKGLQKRDGSIT